MNEIVETVPDREEYKDNKTVPKLYTKTDSQGRTLFFFSEVETKLTLTTLKKDFSNAEEVLKDKGFYSIHETVMETDEGFTFITHDDEEIENDNVVTKVPPGFYNIGESQSFGYFLIKNNVIEGDSYIELGGVFDKIQTTINRFYDNEHIYRELGMIHKMGCLLYGPPGNGKSMLIRELVKKHSDKVVIFVDTDFPRSLIQNLKSFPNNYIFIFEEMTQILRNEYELANLLLFLDGEYSLDGQLVFATTNYPECLPENLASRPSRFDKVIQVGNPDRETRLKYLKNMIPDEDCEKIADLTKDMSIAYLKEIVLTSKINGESIENVIEENKERMKLVQKNFAEKKKTHIGL